MCSIKSHATTYLRSVETDLYNKVAYDLTNGLAWAARQLDGAKAAIDAAYVRLALPTVASVDEVMSAMLFGSERIMDQGEGMRLSAFYLTAAGAPTGTNVRLTSKPVNDARVDLLAGALGRYLNHFAVGYVDGSVAVRSTVNRLNLLRDLLKTPSVNVLPTAPEHSFGSVPVGATKELSLRVANPGMSTLKVSAIAVEGVGFSLVDKTCGAELAAEAECSVKIRYAPTTASKTRRSP